MLVRTHPTLAAWLGYTVAVGEVPSMQQDVRRTIMGAGCLPCLRSLGRAMLQAVQLQKAVAGGWGAAASADATGTAEAGPGSSTLALRAYHAVQRFVALTQLRQVRYQGSVG